MKILRLFITADLEQPIQWETVDDDATTAAGTSTFAELSLFEEQSVEVYLATTCCSILKTDTTCISSKRISEELILGLVEESIIDDITEIKPIILQVEDNTAYVAIFNRIYYDDLIHKLADLGKNIRFVQSFAYATVFEDDCWTVFLSDQQSFVRTNRYEYYTLDDVRPVPVLLTDMLITTEKQPKSFILYTESDAHSAKIEAACNISCKNMSGQFAYGIPIWNFYNQKSRDFRIKLDKDVQNSLLKLIKPLTYLCIALVAFWAFDISSLMVHDYRGHQLQEASLQSVHLSSGTRDHMMSTLMTKIVEDSHNRGLYADYDAITMMRKFFEIVSDITQNNITQIKYTHNQLQIFVEQSFNPSQFTSYNNIFAINHLNATLEDYKTYAAKNKKNKQPADASDDTSDSPPSDTTWVITLQPLDTSATHP